jgi:hypothetical protein
MTKSNGWVMHVSKCICPTCRQASQEAGHDVNTHGDIDFIASAKFNPSVPEGAMEEAKVSERAEDLADARRATVFNHVHVAIGKLFNNY